jgi:hypothetical protein
MPKPARTLGHHNNHLEMSAITGLRPPRSATVAVILAVMAPGFGGDGWESNPPETPQQRLSDSFEDCGGHQSPDIPEPELD